MKRRFTILTAALALLTFLAVPMGMWGQTHTIGWGSATGTEGTYTNFTAESGTVQGILSFTTAKNSSQNAPAYNAGASELRLYYASNGDGGSITITPSSGITITSAEMTTSTNPSVKYSVDGGTATSVSASDNTYTISNISATTSLMIQNANTTNTQLRILTIKLTYTLPTNPVISIEPDDIELGEVSVGNETTAAFSVSQANLTSDITLSVDNGSLSTNSIAQGSSTTSVTWTYTPTTAGAINATVTATSGNTTETLAISGTAIVPVPGYAIDFESAANLYTDWTFNNMTSYQTGSITAHGGTYYGTTGGKATASITTTSTVANPGTLTCYVSKQSGNTTSSTWYIQVSENGSTWTDVESHSATSMSQGSWVEFTADLTDYTNVYVRVYYNGSTAIRNIDDLTLTTVEPSSAVATTTIINVPQNFNTDIHQGTTAGTLTATVKDNENNTISGASVTWSSSNTGVATIDANGAVTLVAVGTTTITASYAGVEDEYRPSTGTYELTVTDSNAPGTENNPYTVAQAIAATPSNGNVYIQGIVSSFYNTSIVGDGNNFRYYISDDGTTTTQLLVYKGKGLNEATFTNADDLLVGDEVVICGTLITYQNAPEVASGNYLYSWNRPSTPSQEYTLTVTASENVEIFTFVGESTDPGVEGSTTLQVYNGTEVGLSVSVTEGYVLTLMVDGTDVTSQLDESGYYTFNMPNHAVTVTATAVEFVPSTGDEYALYTGELVEGDYLIVFDDGAMNTTVTNDRLQYEDVTANNDVIVTDNAAIVWHIAPSGQYWTIYNADADAYAASTGAKNKAQMLADGTDDKALWTVSGTETYEFVNKKNTANNVNANLRKNGTFGFACYATTTGGALSLYKKVENTPAEYTLDIIGYEAGSDGGYYLIASPVTVNPANVEGMTAGEYDLYAFDQAEADEWRNYKQNAFNLEPGKGYLYAKQATEPDEVFHFELTGTTYNGDPIVLKKNDGGDFPGWNLVGNPYTETAYIDRDFYVMQSDGSEIITGEGNEIAAMQGFFVIAANDNEELEISTTAPNTTGEKVIMNVTSNRGNVIDRAIVRFGEGRQLPKFQLRENSTKISIAKDNSEYAVVRSEAEGEMPVSFKAENNGTYTFSVNTENVEMEYLHLIDNMTGADIDLIANPSYSFEAKVTDYASRFRLVFSANSSVNEQNANNFAFFNGNDWTINNEGEATLQVVDMTGRVLSTETVNGNATTKVNAATGVYMLRLINGNNIKTQKVVVK